MNVEGTVSIDFISSLETSKNLNNPLSSVLLESLPQMSIHPSPDFFDHAFAFYDLNTYLDTSRSKILNVGKSGFICTH